MFIDNIDLFEFLSTVNFVIIIFLALFLVFSFQETKHIDSDNFDHFQKQTKPILILALFGTLINSVYGCYIGYIQKPMPYLLEFILGVVVMVEGVAIYSLLIKGYNQLRYSTTLNELEIEAVERITNPKKIIIFIVATIIIAFAMWHKIGLNPLVLNTILVGFVGILLLIAILPENDIPDVDEKNILRFIKVITFIHSIGIVILIITFFQEIIFSQILDKELSYFYPLCFHVFGLIGALTYWKLVQQIVEE